ncbi:MAG TPA: hypothetical protein PL124_08830 [Candidatus Cloacimonadota bacterium]|nr:hypothetical protein [Candidatus Cloacimonadota bacterium]
METIQADKPEDGTPVEAPKSSTIPFRLQYSIDTIHGVYVIKRPSGPIGARHFSLLARCVPSRYNNDGTPMYSPMEEEKQYEAYEKWVPTVLKHIIVTCPVVDGIQITPDTVPPEDQWALFQAVGALMANSGDKPLFRFMDF